MRNRYRVELLDSTTYSHEIALSPRCRLPPMSWLSAYLEPLCTLSNTYIFHRWEWSLRIILSWQMHWTFLNRGIELFYLILIAVSVDDFLIRSISNIWIFVTVISFKMIKRIFQIVQMMVEFYFYIGSWKNNSQLLKFYNRSTIFRFFCFENLFLKKLIFSITRILLERGYYITVRISWNNTKILLNFISIHLGQEGDSK